MSEKRRMFMEKIYPKNDFEKLQMILELIDRQDIGKNIEEKFNRHEQSEIFQMFKGILADEITFVINIKEAEKAQHNQK